MRFKEEYQMKRYVLVMVMLLACFVGLNYVAASKCDAGSVSFQATDVYLEPGQTVIEGTFHNAGDVGKQVTAVKLSFVANDTAGNYIFSDSCLFQNVNAWVPAHGNTNWRFTIHNSAAQGYSGKYEWDVDWDCWY